MDGSAAAAGGSGTVEAPGVGRTGGSRSAPWRGWPRKALAWLDGAFDRLYGARWNPLYQSGAIAVALFLVLLVTGVYLLVFYRIGAPHDSVRRITDELWLGGWVRTLHRYASDATVVAVAVHAFRMFAQRRSWGRRALAWVSGVVLVGLLLVCGWTGYVMVWDVHGQLLAVEGARLLDVLPIFTEPIGRAFVGERPLPAAFFFLNLFAHIALPIGLGVLVWVHVSRVARPTLLPPRGLLWGGLAALGLVAALWPVGAGQAADLLRVGGEATLDLFYGFWIPLARRVSPGAMWLLGGGLTLIVLLVPWWSRPRPAARPAPSSVDPRRCTGCEQCVLDCPYEAIRMVPRQDGRATLLAEVDPTACVSCGICAGSCAPMGVGPPGRTGRDQLERVRAFLARVEPSGTDVVVVGCEASAAGRAGGGGAPFLPLSCAGNLHTSAIEFLLRGGAGGVLVVACPERDCRNREGPKWLEARVHHGREAELQERVDRRRLRVVQAGARDRPRFEAALAELRADVRRIGAAEAGAWEPDEECERSGPVADDGDRRRPAEVAG